MGWWLLLPLSCAVGLYYLLCAFIPAVRIGRGLWLYHITPAALLYVWSSGKNPKSLNDQPVSEGAYLLTSLGFIGIGTAGVLNHVGRLSDDTSGLICLICIAISGVAILLDWLSARHPKVKPDSSVI